MAEYTTARMDEEGQAEVFVPKQAAPKWRRAGLVVGAVCAVAAVAGVAARPKKPTMLRQMSRTMQLFSQGWMERALIDGGALPTARHVRPRSHKDGEAETFELAVSGHMMEEGHEKAEGSEGGSIFHAHVQKADADYPKQILVTFQAKEGQGEGLMGKLNEFKEVMAALLADSQGADAAKEMKESVDVKNKDDEVQLVVNLPSEEEDEANDIKEAMEAEGAGLPMPTFEAKITTGRSLVDIFHKMKDVDESVVSVLGGVSVTLSTNIPGKLITGLAKMMRLSPRDMEKLEAIAALSSVHESFSLKYNKENLKEALADSDLMTPAATRVGLGRAVEHAPYVLKKPLHGLQDVSDGIKSVVIRGLPENLEVILQLTNVKVGPILRTLIGELKAPEEKR